MSRKSWIAPGEAQRLDRVQASISHRGSLDTPAISPEEVTRFDAFLTWVTQLDQKTIREKKIPSYVVDEWTLSLSKSLVPQIDHQAVHRDFRSLEEWITSIADIFPKRLQELVRNTSLRQ